MVTADGLQIIRSDENGMLLELTVPDYTLNDGQLMYPADRLAEPVSLICRYSAR